MLLTSIIVVIATVLTLSVDTSGARAENDVGLVLESHVGARPRDADYLLAPLLDELKRSGFRGSSVAGTRIHSKHSISSKELSSKQVAEVRKTVKDAHAAYLDFRFESAVNTANRAVALLLSRPATMARQQDVRDDLSDALIISSMAHARLGNKAELDTTMTEFVRSFPKSEVSNKKYGPEGKSLYRKINKRLQKIETGELRIAADPGSMIFINESYKGIGSLELQLIPGRYRIYTQTGQKAGRVHIAEVESGRVHTLVVDPVIDSALRTTGKMVGFVFEDEAARAKHEKRIALEVGRALGAERIILVGFHKFNGKYSIVASSIAVEDRESGPSARVPLPQNGAPSASQLRALAAFVAGSKPASLDIQVMSTDEATPIETRTASGASGDSSSGRYLEMNAKSKRSDTGDGISSAWRWTSWAAGAASLGAGSYLLAIHDTGTCANAVCPENYDTQAPGIGLIAGGVAVGLLGFYLWTYEGDGESTNLAVVPATDGFRAALTGTF
ncbi:MAG: hypothetical protein GY811_12780 [Myxococcales bacterium]|nr:hypothetical protein [Myxococcales bacterium]